MTGRTFHLTKISVQPFDMQMERAVQMEIFWNERKTFGGTLLFPFQPDGMEITIPFAPNSISTAHKSAEAYTNVLCYHDLPMTLQVFRPPGKKPFLLTRKAPQALICLEKWEKEKRKERRQGEWGMKVSCYRTDDKLTVQLYF